MLFSEADFSLFVLPTTNLGVWRQCAVMGCLQNPESCQQSLLQLNDLLTALAFAIANMSPRSSQPALVCFRMTL